MQSGGEREAWERERGGEEGARETSLGRTLGEPVVARGLIVQKKFSFESCRGRVALQRPSVGMGDFCVLKVLHAI